MQPYSSLGPCEIYPGVITHSGEIPELGLCEGIDGTPSRFRSRSSLEKLLECSRT